MIQPRTMLKVADNSGAKIVQCFKVLGGTRRRYAQIGDIVIASVKVAQPRKSVAKKDVVRCLIVRQKKPYRREDGSYIRFDDNAVVLIDNKNQPRGTRIFGPIPREIKQKGFDEVASLAVEIL
ncbi:MAG TPA: 50S ribosomal protein L14 [Candidatus Paceibacterota bacterium]|nr:50S ribosomal protein L14 [Candidatus Paceibacterota bacterium]HOK20611.1 50S ribosomal protein L14 [Candidatus Paceibacterota bacterium]HOL54013.1 50S ribosomal protein L14 [Candidatus Paceibacterota bacterium]HON21763.1 50S ribosomal protein L14 [Candidatus Paceibacterota bacterium]HOV88597.1 50S ribosomal protein L14 [Candidatus Paceibacterota bacterium]